MNNDLVKHIDYGAIDDAIGSDIDGDPLKFKDGVFLRGFDKTEVEEGTTLRIAPTSVQDGYVKWEDGKPVDWRLREWINRGSSADLPRCNSRCGQDWAIRRPLDLHAAPRHEGRG